LLSCITCKASTTVRSGDTNSGFGVITFDTGVLSRGSSFATALVIMSLKPKIPTNSPFSTTNEAFLDSDINMPASLMEELGLTIDLGFPASKLRSVGEVFPPKACDMSGPRRSCRAAAWAVPAPCRPASCFTASWAASFPCSFARSSLLMASFRHFAISSNPTMDPSSSKTGKWRK